MSIKPIRKTANGASLSAFTSTFVIASLSLCIKKPKPCKSEKKTQHTQMRLIDVHVTEISILNSI